MTFVTFMTFVTAIIAHIIQQVTSCKPRWNRRKSKLTRVLWQRNKEKGAVSLTRHSPLKDMCFDGLPAETEAEVDGHGVQIVIHFGLSSIGIALCKRN